MYKNMYKDLLEEIGEVMNEDVVGLVNDDLAIVQRGDCLDSLTAKQFARELPKMVNMLCLALDNIEFNSEWIKIEKPTKRHGARISVNVCAIGNRKLNKEAKRLVKSYHGTSQEKIEEKDRQILEEIWERNPNLFGEFQYA